MRAMGIIRRLDELGRVVIPVEMRRMLDLADRDTVEIAVDEALGEYHNRRVCASCMRELSAMGGGTKVARRRTED